MKKGFFKQSADKQRVNLKLKNQIFISQRLTLLISRKEGLWGNILKRNILLFCDVVYRVYTRTRTYMALCQRMSLHNWIHCRSKKTGLARKGRRKRICIKQGFGTEERGVEGGGVNTVVRKTPDIALYSTYVSTLWFKGTKGRKTKQHTFPLREVQSPSHSSRWSPRSLFVDILRNYSKGEFHEIFYFSFIINHPPTSKNPNSPKFNLYFVFENYSTNDSSGKWKMFKVFFFLVSGVYLIKFLLKSQLGYLMFIHSWSPMSLTPAIWLW